MQVHASYNCRLPGLVLTAMLYTQHKILCHLVTGWVLNRALVVMGFLIVSRRSVESRYYSVAYSVGYSVSLMCVVLSSLEWIRLMHGYGHHMEVYLENA